MLKNAGTGKPTNAAEPATSATAGNHPGPAAPSAETAGSNSAENGSVGRVGNGVTGDAPNAPTPSLEKRRGRPIGSKNKPKNGAASNSEPAKQVGLPKEQADKAGKAIAELVAMVPQALAEFTGRPELAMTEKRRERMSVIWSDYMQVRGDILGENSAELVLAGGLLGLTAEMVQIYRSPNSEIAKKAREDLEREKSGSTSVVEGNVIPGKVIS